MFKFLPGPCSPTSCSPTKSTARRPRRRPRCSKRCRNAKSPLAVRDYPMHDPFFVLATQNPIEQEGTYPLPEAQLDRFLFLIKVDYPDATRKRNRSCARALRTASVDRQGAARRRHFAFAARRPPRAGGRSRLRLRQATDAHEPAEHAGSGRLREQMADLGRRSARQHELDPRRQGARGACTATSTSRPTTWPLWPRRSCAIASSPISPPRAKASLWTT